MRIIDRGNPILSKLYRGTTTIQNFNWEALTTAPILSLMTPDDVKYIRDLILSPRYSGNSKLKTEKIDELMHARGFTKFAGGTNRLVYIHPAAANAVFKVAIDSVGIGDNPAEFKNQQFLKPFCCKVFECSPCGTIASFERVDRITTFDEFYSIREDYYQLVTKIIIGKYVMDDIGTNYFMNYGIRYGFGPVILDFPYMFELDGSKLTCPNVLDNGKVCTGEIDYDPLFNKLVCTKCGRVFRARDLAKPPASGGRLSREKGGRRMILEVKRGDKVIKRVDNTIECDHLSRNDRDTMRNRKPEVVLKYVKVETKKVQSPVKETASNAETNKVVSTTKVEKPAVRKIIKTIDVSPNKNKVTTTDAVTTTETQPNHYAEVVLTTHKVNLVSKETKEPKQDSNTSKTTSAPKAEVETVEKPIVGRIIDVSIGKPKQSTDVVVAETSSKPIVQVNLIRKTEGTSSVSKKTEEKVEQTKTEPVVKAEKKVVKTVKVSASDGRFDAYKKRISQSDAVKEEEDTGPVVEEGEQTIALKSGTTVIRPAIYFGDDPNDYDPEEDVKSEEKPSDDHKYTFDADAIHSGNVVCALMVINCDADTDINMIMHHFNEHNEHNHVKRNGDVVCIHHVDKDEDGNEIANYINFYTCLDAATDVWDLIDTKKSFQIPLDEFVYDNSIGEKVDDSQDDAISNETVDPVEAEKYPDVDPDSVEAEETESVSINAEEVSNSNEEVESTSEETTGGDDDYYLIKLVDKAPDVKDAEADTFYCVPRHSRVDTTNFDSIENPVDIDYNQYRIYFLVEGSVEQIMFDYDEENWIVCSKEVADASKFESYELVSELPEFEKATVGTYYLLETSVPTIRDVFSRHEGESVYDYICQVSNFKTPKASKKSSKKKSALSDDEVEKLKASSKKKSLDDLLAGK